MNATHTAHASSARYARAGGPRVSAAVMPALAGLLGVFRGIMAIAEDEGAVDRPTVGRQP
ncbi:hypothetical protein [Streptomyces globisporus]|uniref:hypothetical protein n=1 Tax=Streptomyces globisporus TaxID=1908 RepID=UPI0004C48C17|nr:hypothetical protein [Streptomyces globisporus]